MKRVPEWLPHTIRAIGIASKLHSGAIDITDLTDVMVDDTVLMTLMLYQSPAIIAGLLMTEVQTPTKEVERFFFGYKCSVCDRVYLLSGRVRDKVTLQQELAHECEQSELRRAVRRAREMGRERGEVILEGIGGEWWTEKRTR